MGAPSDADVLRELHDTYVWEVNAAVGEDRMDLVWRLSDEYAERALHLMAELAAPGCGRPECVICARGTGTPEEAARRGRRRRLRHRWRH
jgi:hypothetical protein